MSEHTSKQPSRTFDHAEMRFVHLGFSLSTKGGIPFPDQDIRSMRLYLPACLPIEVSTETF